MVDSTSRVPETHLRPGVDGGRPITSLLAAAGMAPMPAASQSATDGRPIPRLPLPQIHASPGTRLRFASTTMDDRGRLADRTIVRSLGWGPQSAITVTVPLNAGIIAVLAGGTETLTSGGFLRLSANTRHTCRLRPGDWLLLVARLADRVLLAYTPYAVDAMTSAYHAATSGPELR